MNLPETGGVITFDPVQYEIAPMPSGLEDQTVFQFNPAVEEAPEIALALRRALHNVPEDAGISPERIEAAKSLANHFVDASLVARKTDIADRVDAMVEEEPWLGARELPLVEPPVVMEANGETKTGALFYRDAPGPDGVKVTPRVATEEEKPETVDQFRARVRREARDAAKPQPVTQGIASVFISGLRHEILEGDRTAVTPEEDKANRQESRIILAGITRAIYLPVGNNGHVLRISADE